MEKTQFERLRKKAESVLKDRYRHVENIPKQDIEELINEINVYQIELEMQNEELKHIQKELERSRDRFSILYHNAPVGYIVMDNTGMVIDANQTICTMVGKMRVDLLNKPFSQLIVPNEKQLFYSRFKTFFKKPQSKRIEIRLVTGDDSTFYARLEGRFLTSESKSENELVDNLLLIINDISDIKKTEEKLYEQQLLLKTVLDELPFWISLKDKDGRYLVVNRPMADDHGVTVEDFIHSTLVEPEGFYPKQLPKMAARDDRVLIRGERIEVPEYPIMKNNTLRWRRLVKIPWKTKKNKIEGIICWSEDITERKQSNEALALQRKIENELSRLSAFLLTTTEMAAISYEVLQTAKKLTKSRYGFVGSIDPETGYFVCHTMTQDIWSECNLPDKSYIFEQFTGLWGWVLKNQEAIIVNDLKNDPRSTGTPSGHIPIEAFLGVPAVIGSEVVGEIVLANPENRFIDIDLTIVKRIATLYSMAIQRFRYETALVAVEAQKADELEKLVTARTAELYKSKELLEKVFISQTDAIFVFDKSNPPLIVDCNPAAETLFGKTRDAIIGKPADFFDDCSRHSKHFDLDGFAERNKNGTIHLKEYYFHRTDDTRIPVEVNAAKLLNENDIPIGSVVVMRNISERKKAEDALASSEERLKLALDSVRDAVWDWRVDTGEVYFSPRWFSMLGYENNELPMSYETFRDLIHPEDLVEAEQIIGKHLKSAQPFELDFRMRTKNGQWKWVLSRGRTVKKDDQGNALRMIGTHMDITERKHLESRLQQSQKMESIGSLAAGVAHEINNPINGIINYAQILIDEIEEEEKCDAELPKRIIKEGERIAMIVRNLLSFARKSDETRSDIAVQRLLRDTLGLIGHQLIKDGIQAIIDIPETLPLISVNPQKMQQVFVNLINNAQYALNQKYPEHDPNKMIRIEATVREVKTEKWVRLTFHDNGIGIPSDIIDKVCDPFFSTKPTGIGTGLGLSISYGIVRDQGGKISFESEHNAYTRVRVDLPIASTVTNSY